MVLRRSFLFLAVMGVMISSHLAAAVEWRLIWADEFNAPANTGADTTKWHYNLWEPGTVNGEAQKYTDRIENVFHDGKGNIVLRGLRDNWKNYQYTSGRLESEGRIEFSYTHKVVVRAILPAGRGSWPALWLLATKCCWPGTGEIDFMEQWGQNKSSIQCDTHTGGNPGDIGPKNYNFKTATTSVTDFHEYACEWYKDSLLFFVDGNRFGSSHYQGGPFNTNVHYIILNVALGGMMGGGIDNNMFPMDMVIDWVRVYSGGTEAAPVLPGKSHGSANTALFPSIRTIDNEIVVSTAQSSAISTVELITLAGRTIRTCRPAINSARLNTAAVTPGIYCLRVKSGESVWSSSVYIHR
jgi:beta-glucanase (GH16 family)